MHKARTFLILGIWVAILPFLGFPYAWKDVLFMLTGLGLIFLSYTIHKEEKKRQALSQPYDNFRENKNFGKETSAETDTLNSTL